MREVAIDGEWITLGALLKFAGLAGSGAEAKQLLATGDVLVDGEPELRRGRKLRRGALVSAAGKQLRVA